VWYSIEEDEGNVEDELYRGDEDEVSYKPPLDAELCVPPLPLHGLASEHSNAEV
jgi:hypothetical protein